MMKRSVISYLVIFCIVGFLSASAAEKKDDSKIRDNEVILKKSDPLDVDLSKTDQREIAGYSLYFKKGSIRQTSANGDEYFEGILATECRFNVAGLEYEFKRNARFKYYRDIFCSGTLFRSTTINGIKIPAGSIIEYNNYPCNAYHLECIRLADKAVIVHEGRKYIASLYIQCNGKISSGYLSESITINGNSYTGEIRYYPSGKVLEAKVMNPFPYKQTVLDGNISFFETGEISKGHLFSNVTYSGTTLKGFVYFYENGKIKKGQLASTFKLPDNRYINMDENIGFLPDGTPCEASRVDPPTNNGGGGGSRSSNRR